ncbi:cell wall-binding repeat-containing protein [Agromyces albus]|uniref:cell wall-binding repeat-containing protein n=1 Tax=Agromyces albus TaxID=205332 RepID=UPI003BB12770
MAGIVTGSDGAPAIGIRVEARDDDGGWLPPADTDESGAYRFENIAANRYTLTFTCWNTCVGNYVAEYWNDTRRFDSKAWFDVGVGERVDLETELELAGEISGVVRGDDGATLEGVNVDITSDTAGVVPPQDFATTDAEGRYRFRNLPEAGYILRFAPQTAFAHEYFSEFWKDQANAGTADVVRVTAGEAVSGIDPALTPAAWISGRVLNEDGIPAGWDADVNIFLYRVTDAGTSWVWTGSLGHYPLGPGEFRFDGLTSGTYVLKTRALGWGIAEWWQDKSDLASADRIVLDMGERFDTTIVLEDGPVSLTGPRISGVARVGETLTAAASSPTPSVTLAYQWFADDVPIDGANQPTHALTAADLGAGIAVEVAASAPGRTSVTRRSSMTSDVQPAVLTSGTPRIIGSGLGLVGSTLTVDPGVWTDGTALTYEWRADGVPIESADDPSLLLTPSEVDKRVSVAVTGSKPGYASVTKVSNWFAVSFGPTDLTTPVILGTPEVGSTLTASASSTTPGVSLSYHWHGNGLMSVIGQDQTLVLTDEHAGYEMSVEVFATAPGYLNTQKSSSATLPVRFTPQDDVTRLAGTDRYATSVAISKSQFNPGVPVAFVASGVNFPDALAGAPVAGISGGPMLLTDPNGLPDSVRAELERLQPQRIVVLGGTATVSSSVEAQLDTIRPGAITRLAGPDRYATSVAISESQFEPGVPVVFIASGAKFPDALAGAPVAGITGGPMLLTDPNGLPDSVKAELERLQPKRIVILGGTSTISDAVEAQLQGLQPGAFTRLAGSDRYETSALISASQFQPGVPVVFIASGAKFPDALAGAPVAGITGGPMLLTDPNGLPDAVKAELERLQPKRIVILGGTSTVSDAVEARLDALW